jgi:hypothetical protein
MRGRGFYHVGTRRTCLISTATSSIACTPSVCVAIDRTVQNEQADQETRLLKATVHLSTWPLVHLATWPLLCNAYV